MFDPRKITASVLGYAPQFILTRFSSVIMGIIAAYGVLLFFFGHPPFFRRAGELSLMMTLAYWAARVTRYGIMWLVYLADGTAPESTEAAVATAGAGPEGASSLSSSVGAKPSPTSQAEVERCESKGLD
ncbi:hypothetical protein IOCL2690_000500900 [Leishmania lindenbergi]|uniref:Uncharacterized protein n=1 Tax=Leishmania lindenbergi TaxID=651832 RepID=A0AAW3A9J6_9TRYP